MGLSFVMSLSTHCQQLSGLLHNVDVLCRQMIFSGAHHTEASDRKTRC